MESTLGVSLARITEEVGEYLGFGSNQVQWSGWNPNRPYVPLTPDSQLGRMMRFIESGLRYFYWPMPAQGHPAPRWSFLIPEYSFDTVADQADYDMPDDFGGLEGDLAYDSTTGMGIQIRKTGLGEIRRLASASGGMTTRPDRYAEVPVKTMTADGESGQRWQIVLSPTPDAVYTLDGRYNILPNTLDVTRPFPYGSASHGETILEACLACAETKVRPAETTHRELYKARLEASIGIDSRQNAPANLGQNLDRSDWRSRGGYTGPIQTVQYVGFV